MNNKIITVFAIVFIFVLISVIPYGVNTDNHVNEPQSTHPFSFSITQPSYTYLNESFNIYVNSTAGYHNYSVAAYLGADNDSGLLPLFYYNHHVHNYNFTISATAPSECEYIYGYIDTSAQNSTNAVSYNNYTIAPINVSRPVVFSSTVVNSDPVPIYNTTLTYTVIHSKTPYLVGQSHINKIPANTTYKDNITVPLAIVPKGKDTLSVTSNNPIITISGKSNVVFYNGKAPNYNWIYYIAAVVVALAVFLIVASGRRNTVKVPKWKRNKKTKAAKAAKTK